MKNNSSNPFPTLEFSREARALAAQGSADALAERPTKTDTTLPTAFVNSRAKLRSIYEASVAACQDELNTIESKIDDLIEVFGDSGLRNKMRTIIDKMETSLNTSKHKAQCIFNRKEFEKRKKDMERFQLDNDLIYQPERGISTKTFLGISPAIWIVLSLYLIESVFNAALFISEVGMLGGLTISLSSSMVNVLVGYLVGRFVFSRIYLHPSIINRFMFLSAFLLFIFTIVYMNLMIALYRSLKAAENSFQIVNVSDAIWPFPHLAQLDFNSSLVLIVGFVFAIVALLDGYFSDEPFPGYGHKYRLCLNSREAVQKVLEAYKRELIAEIQIARDGKAKAFKIAGNAIASWGSYVNKVQRLFDDYVVWLAHLIDVQKLCWDSYCSAHESHRLSGYIAPPVLSTEPRPFVDDQPYPDPNHIFRDAKHLYMSDEDRLSKMTEYKNNLATSRSIAEKTLEEKVDELKKELKLLEEQAECHI